MQSREWRLAERPFGEPKLSDFALATVDVAEPVAGQLLVRNVVMSVDPYMRGRMNDVKSYAPPWQIDAACEGGAVGEVVSSTVDSHAVGDLVLHNYGWREYAVGQAGDFQRVDRTTAHPSAYLGVLGMPGLTAYAGLYEVAAMKEGDTVFVSGAAGAVGSLVGQLAKLRGGTVIGSAGSAEKVAWLKQLGFDAAFSYRDGPVLAQLQQAAPDGIDVYFDNVGGEHLEAAISALKVHGRIAVCGMISRYNDTEPQPGPSNIGMVVGKRLSIRGFLVWDHAALMPDFVRDVSEAVADGRLQVRETVAEGLDNAPAAFLGLLRGENIGKMVVRIA